MKQKHILLINPWIADFAAYDLWAKPLGLLYVGKFLRKFGYSIDLIDVLDRNRWRRQKQSCSDSGRGKYKKTIIPKPELLRNIPRNFGIYGAERGQFRSALLQVECPDIILVTSHMTYWYPGVLETVKVIKEVFPDTLIILGGTYATLCPDHAKKTIKPDYLIRGYGEKIALRLLDELFGIKRNYGSVPEFDDSGAPPWDLYDHLDAVPVMTSRGCPNSCSYCATRKLHPCFLQRTVEDVVREIKTVYTIYNVRNIAFYDDALFSNSERHIIPILEQIIDLGLNMNFHSPNGLFAREIDGYLAKLLKKSGFKTIRLSLESSIPKFQKASSGKITNNDFIRAMGNLVEAGFDTAEIEVYLLMGLPDQTAEHVRESIEFVAEHGAISRLVSFSPIPYTAEWTRARKMGFVTDGLDPLMTNNTVYACRNKSFPQQNFSELRQLSNQLNNRQKTKQ